jgi:hypothetical protein
MWISVLFFGFAYFCCNLFLFFRNIYFCSLPGALEANKRKRNPTKGKPAAEAIPYRGFLRLSVRNLGSPEKLAMQYFGN